MSAPTFKLRTKPLPLSEGGLVFWSGQRVGTVWLSPHHGWQWCRVGDGKGAPFIGGKCVGKRDGLKAIRLRLSEEQQAAPGANKWLKT